MLVMMVNAAIVPTNAKVYITKAFTPLDLSLRCGDVLGSRTKNSR